MSFILSMFGFSLRELGMGDERADIAEENADPHP